MTNLSNYLNTLVVLLSSLFFTTTIFSQSANIHAKISTFLGSPKRNYYGNKAPDKLDIIWKTNLGCGRTIKPNKTRDTSFMCGAGWTGQALLIEEDNELYLIQGAYDHKLKKIKAKDGKIIWEYAYDDVIKSTGTFWTNPNKKDDDPDKYLIFQGSRRGFGKSAFEKFIPSYRAVSYRTGKEVWRYNSVKSDCFSRDVDGTALVVDDTIFLGLETGYFVKLNPNPDSATIAYENYKQPKELYKQKLYNDEDIKAHRGNLVIESSPALLDDKIYVTSGAGYLYAYNRKKGGFDFTFYIGSDIDGSPVITRNNCVLVSIEEQYIKGKGGAMLINPKLNADSAVVWFYPTNTKKFADWQGGIIGTCAVNDHYIKDNENSLCAFVAIDGYLYVVENEFINKHDSVLGPDNITKYPKPQEVFKQYVGTSISTPIFVENKLIVLTYEGLYMFKYDDKCIFSLIEKNTNIRGEATPIVYNKRLYVASRDGNLYCLGDKNENN